MKSIIYDQSDQKVSSRNSNCDSLIEITVRTCGAL